MAPEALIASHACSHIGAVAGADLLGLRRPRDLCPLADAGAKVVICADASYRRGAVVPMKAVLDDALAEAPVVEHVIVWRRMGGDCPMTPGATSGGPTRLPARPRRRRPCSSRAKRPYLLAYTSGTTGKPKGALHVQAAFLLSIAREAAYQADLQRR